MSKDGVLNMPVLCAQLPLSMVYDEPYAPIRSSLLAGKSDARIGLIVGWLSGAAAFTLKFCAEIAREFEKKAKAMTALDRDMWVRALCDCGGHL